MSIAKSRSEVGGCAFVQPCAEYRKKRLLLFLVISIGYLVVFFQRVAPAVVGPVLSEELGVDATAIGLMASMYFWAQSIGCIPSGLLVDTFSPRVVAGTGLVCAAIGGAVFALGESIAVLSAGRFIIGLSITVVFLGAMKIFGEWYRPDELATCSGVLLAVGNVGALLSTTPLHMLMAALGWRGAFLLVAGYSACAGLLCWIVLRDRPEVCGFTSVHPGPRETPKVSMRAALKVVWSTPGFYLVTIATTLFYGTIMNTGGLWAGPFLQDVCGLDKGTASGIVLFFTLGMIAGCPLSGWLSDKIVRSRKKVLLAGLLAQSLIYLPLAFWTGSLTSPVLLSLIFFLFGTTGGFFGVCFACVKETLGTHAEHCGATAMGSLNMGIAVGAAVYQNICGMTLDAFGRVNGVYSPEAYASCFRICLTSILVAAVIMTFFREKPRS